MSASNPSIQVKSDFSVRIVVCDHYLSKPTPGIDVIYSEFRGSDIKQVPVLRIFGPAPDGHKACLHVHGVFPYFYIPCPTSNPEPQFLYQIAASLDKALNIALKQATSASQHVYKISLVKGLPFYGFHDKDHLYLKVFLYSPNLIKQAVELCANGAILGQTFQPHESHLNFTLQFFIDFNLFGMSNIDVQSVKFRRSGLSQNSNEPVEGSEEFRLRPESICYYEADCVASHIINRQRIGKGDGIENPGLEEVWNQEKERRKQLNVSMASKSLTQARIDAEQTDSHYKFEQMCILKLSGLIDKPVEIRSKDQEYPAESLEGSQLFNAVDVSVHIPDQTLGISLSDTRRNNVDDTLIEEADNTLVDENLALNCSFSLRYSQVQLDNDDLELVDLLQDLDEKPVEEDSILATPADKEEAGEEYDDAEYSQVFHDDTIVLEDCKSKVDGEESWNDSFWDGANIPQLDGTCDDDHVKKVRKRKMRPFKLGLARPKTKSKKRISSEENCTGKNEESDRNKKEEVSTALKSKTKNINESDNMDLSNLLDMDSDISEDEINASRETVDSISELHLRKSFKKDFVIFSDSPVENTESNQSVLDSEIVKDEPVQLGEAEKYDLEHKYKPTAGPSNMKTIHTNIHKYFDESLNDSYESTPEDNKGIKSFYDVSKIFDLSLEDSKCDDMDISLPISQPEPDRNIKIKEHQENSTMGLEFLNQSSFKNSSYQSVDDGTTPVNDADLDAYMSPKIYEERMQVDENSSLQKQYVVQSDTISNHKNIIETNSQFENDSPLPINGPGLDIIMSSTDECQEKSPVIVGDNDLKLNSNLFLVDEIRNKSHTNTQLDFRENTCFTQQCNAISDNVEKILTPRFRAPTTSYIKSTLEKYNLPKVKNSGPYYSDYKDVGDKVEIGLLVLKLQSKLAKDQKPYEKVIDTTSIEEWRQLMFLQTNELNEATSKPDALKTLLAGNRHCVLEPIKKPPTSSEVKTWLKLKEEERNNSSQISKKNTGNEISKTVDDLDNSQAIGLIYEDEINSSASLETKDENENEKDKSLNTTLQVSMQQDGSFLCFGNNKSEKESSSLEAATVEVDFLTVMATEVLASTVGDLPSDPDKDSIQAVFLTIRNDCPPDHILKRSHTEIIVVDEMKPPKLLDRCVFEANVSYVNSENEILEKVIDLIKLHDPDIMCGYEIENNSWGYILERAQFLGIEIVKEVSRITEKNRQKRWRSDEKDFEGRIIGRIMFNVWRLFRYELALSSYSFENCMYEILKERVPKYSHSQLYEWWNHESKIFRWIPVEFYLTRLSGTVRMLQKLDIINRTSELARLFGLQWWEVLSRGSQFRVESLMLRAARPLNLVALSPTVRQRAAMKAPECLPLIFEPESRFYTDPVIVLDFQSLYPSMMIAYNYCFSTCIGRVQNINGDASYEFGAWRLRIPEAKLQMLVRNGLVNFSPVGVGFVKPSVRRGVLPALLRRILAARQAVKKGMKLQTDEAVKKAMHSRQLGLKLIANVTYGYTAANFSGRMPCVEVADSVVAKGRETLERAIRLVRDSGRWNAKVVYGDTDSMFVVVPGGTRAEAFHIGQQIADAVTADNPAPVALKLEKVYQPCILQTKKRYVGFMYESAAQETPVYEAKGIETVRRDGCPAGVKLLQRSLCELFTHGDMSRVKRIVTATMSRLVAGSIPSEDLLFTREYHGAGGYRPGASAPPNEIAKRLSARSARAAPRPGERVSWLVSAGPPHAPLLKLARTPEEIIRDPAPPHVAYYATRVLLPPLHRCLSLLGADVFKWWTELGYTRSAQYRSARGALARYVRVRDANGRVEDAKGTAKGRVIALAKAARCSEDIALCDMACRSCANHIEYSVCGNTECPVLWRAITARRHFIEARDLFNQTGQHSLQF